MLMEVELAGRDPENQASFIIRPDQSGIDLASFELEGKLHQVTETLVYVPWMYGKETPGSGQLGIYRVIASPNTSLLAVVKDYRRESNVYPWGIGLISLAKDKGEILGDFAVDTSYGVLVYLHKDRIPG